MFCFCGSRPIALHTVAIRSGTFTGFSSTPVPSSPVLPNACPPLMPPPASAADHEAGQWSRPLPPLIFGVRAELAHAHHDRTFEQPAILQIGKQRAEGGVERRKVLHLIELLVACPSRRA